MDELMLELELLKQFEDTEEVEDTEQEEERYSPYQNANQEAMGQIASMFQSLDNLFLEFEEENDKD